MAPSRAARRMSGSAEQAVREQQRRRGEHPVERLGHERAVRGDQGGVGRSEPGGDQPGAVARQPPPEQAEERDHRAPGQRAEQPHPVGAAQAQLHKSGERQRIERRPLGGGDRDALAEELPGPHEPRAARHDSATAL